MKILIIGRENEEVQRLRDTVLRLREAFPNAEIEYNTPVQSEGLSCSGWWIDELSDLSTPTDTLFRLKSRRSKI